MFLVELRRDTLFLFCYSLLLMKIITNRHLPNFIGAKKILQLGPSRSGTVGEQLETLVITGTGEI